MVLGEGNVSLLLASWSVQGVNLLNLEFVKLLAGHLNHLFVSSFVHNENKSVVVFDGLDSRLTAQWVVDDAEVVVHFFTLHSSQQNLWSSLLVSHIGSSESHSAPDLSFFSGVGSLLNNLSCFRGVILHKTMLGKVLILLTLAMLYPY